MDDRSVKILQRFADSWIETEKFYDDLITNYSGWERLNSIRDFIDNLKRKGENRFFRLGTSIHILVISRSVDHGLRSDQKCIRIDAFDNKFEVVMRDADKIYRRFVVESLYDQKVENLLKTLKHTLVD